MLPYVMAYNRPAAASSMADIAVALGIDAAGRDADELAGAAIARVAEIFAAIGITPTLKALGLPEDRLDWTAEQAIGIERLVKNNPRPIDLPAMRRLVRAAYDGDLPGAR